MRDTLWLEQKLDYVWKKYFCDIKQLNNVSICFGRKAKKRLASIRQRSFRDKNSDTEIRVTSFYKDKKVPEFVIEATIAHEICHYAHGFASPHPQYCKHPHRGDVVDKELAHRGLGETLKKQNKWLKENWQTITYTAKSKPKSKTAKQILGPWSQFIRIILGY